MNKSDLVQALSSKTDLSRTQALRAIEVLFSTDDGLIIDALKRGETAPASANPNRSKSDSRRRRA